MLMYKFRFITAPLLSSYKQLTTRTLRDSLHVLVEQKYINKEYEANWRLLHKPAIYSLAKKGIAVLKTDPRVHTKTLHLFYKNNSVSEAFKQHTIDTLAVYNSLKRLYGDRFDMFTRQEIMQYRDFPKTKPDIYLRSAEDEYIIILVHDVMPFIAKKRFIEQLRHFDEEGWGGKQYPTLLFIFARPADKRRFLKYATEQLENAGIREDELQVGATAMDNLLTAASTVPVWSFARKAERLMSVDSLV